MRDGELMDALRRANLLAATAVATAGGEAEMVRALEAIEQVAAVALSEHHRARNDASIDLVESQEMVVVGDDDAPNW